MEKFWQESEWLLGGRAGGWLTFFGVRILRSTIRGSREKVSGKQLENEAVMRIEKKQVEP